MFELCQTPIQSRIQFAVTNGLGFGRTNYLSLNSVYKEFLSEEEIKNTRSGLKAHLAEMNFDRDIKKYFELKNKFGLFGKIASGFYYANLRASYQNLKDDAVGEAAGGRGGLMKMFLQKTLMIDNIIFLMAKD